MACSADEASVSSANSSGVRPIGPDSRSRAGPSAMSRGYLREARTGRDAPYVRNFGQTPGPVTRDDVMRSVLCARPFVRFALLAIAAVTLAGLALRVWGEHRFEVVATGTETSGAPAAASPLALEASALLAGGEDTDVFRTLGPATEALEARFALADAATRTLDVQYYGFHHDASGRALLGRLAGAAGRGVAVRLLLDDIGIGRRADCLARLSDRSPGLEVRIFNPTALRGSARLFEFAARFPRVTRRMHNKSMTADRAVSIVGGRNISDLYFDGDDVDVGFADFDVLVAGDVAGAVTDSFGAYWDSGLSIDVDRLASAARDEDCGPEVVVTHAPAMALAALLGAGTDAGPFAARAALVVDPPEKVVTPLRTSVDYSGASVMRLLASAKKELLLSSPYFVPSGRGMSVFAELRERGVRVSILTNSLASNDVPAVHASYAGYREALLRLGVELHEFRPLAGDGHDWSLLESERASLHAKTFVIDGTRVFVGSFNLDPRSFFHNTEMGVVLDDADFGRIIGTRWHETLPRVAYRLELDETGAVRWHEALDGGHERVHDREPMTSATDRLLVRAMAWLPVEWLM